MRGAEPVSGVCASAAGGASGSASAAGSVAGFAVFTSRGGGRDGAAGFTGSAAFLAGTPFFPLSTGVSANMSPPGNEMLRWRARRSTNWRATTSSIVLEALFTSMP